MMVAWKTRTLITGDFLALSNNESIFGHIGSSNCLEEEFCFVKCDKKLLKQNSESSHNPINII